MGRGPCFAYVDPVPEGELGHLSDQLDCKPRGLWVSVMCVSPQIVLVRMLPSLLGRSLPFEEMPEELGF